MRHLAEHAGGNGAPAEQFLRLAQAARRRADLVRRAMMEEGKTAARAGDVK